MKRTEQMKNDQMMRTHHIAVLVSDLERTAERLPGFCRKGPIETYEQEGTRELYVEIGGADSTMLLLMQPVGEGPYRDALEKRGPGLHHIGCSVRLLSDVRDHITRHRLLLHPVSITTSITGTAWLCRPGVPFLVELFESSEEFPESSERTVLGIPTEHELPHHVRGFFPDLTLWNTDDGTIQLRQGDRFLSVVPD